MVYASIRCSARLPKTVLTSGPAWPEERDCHEERDRHSECTPSSHPGDAADPVIHVRLGVVARRHAVARSYIRESCSSGIPPSRAR